MIHDGHQDLSRKLRTKDNKYSPRGMTHKSGAGTISLVMIFVAERNTITPAAPRRNHRAFRENPMTSPAASRPWPAVSVIFIRRDIQMFKPISRK